MATTKKECTERNSSEPVLKKSNRGGKRSKKNRLIKNKKRFKFSIMGNNTAGLKSKKDSLSHIIKVLDFPSCITLQETKFISRGNIKLDNYDIFEKVRTDKGGGGLLTAVDQNLDPAEVECSNSEVEILIVQCQVNNMKMRIINCYGPQESDSELKRLEFWQTLEQEIVCARAEDCLVLVQMDANAKVGKSIITGDPNDQSENGHLLVEMAD